MAAYYNEIDRYAADWLRNLIAAGHLPAGDVDERSILDVRSADLAGYTQCHFFAGIGGWPYALRLAGFPDDRPVWTGSCPCQPLSSAGQRKGHVDERHLWPAFQHLIAERHPPIVFGEQVAGPLGKEWLAAVRADLADVGYAVGAADLCAPGVGALHIRQRLYWVADGTEPGRGRGSERLAEPDGRPPAQPRRLRDPGAMADAPGQRCDRAELAGAAGTEAERGAEAASRRASGILQSEGRGGSGPMADADGGGWGSGGEASRPQARAGAGSDRCDAVGLMVDADRDGRESGRSATAAARHRPPAVATGGMGDAGRQGLSPCQCAELPEQVRLQEGRATEQSGRPLAAARNPWAEIEWIPCADGKARPTKSAVQWLVDGLPASLGRLRPDQIGKITEEVNAHASEGDPREAVSDVWRALWEEAVQRPPGGPISLHEARFLLAFLLQLAEQGWALAQSLPFPSEEVSQAGVRSLLWHDAAARASRGRGLDEQRSPQPPDSLRLLSSILARHAQAAWAETLAANAAAAFPLAYGVAGRVGKLRAYGNAIVPALAAVFIESVMEVLE